MGDDRPSVYIEEGITVYRASALGNCKLNLVLCKAEVIGETPPVVISKAWRTGHRLEDEIVYQVCEKENVLPIALQPEVTLQVNETTIIRCHPDAFVQDSKLNSYVLEVKSMSEGMTDVYKRAGLDAYPGYVWQWAVEMLGSDLPGIYGIGIKHAACDANGCEGCTNGILEVLTKRYSQPVKTLAEVEARVLEVEATFEAREAGDPVECDRKQWPCEFYQMHDKKKGIWAVDEAKLSEEIQSKLDGLISYLDDTVEELKYYETEKEDTRNQIFELLKKTGVTKAGRAVIVSSKGRVSFDTKKMKEDLAATGMEMSKYEKIGPPSEFLRVESVKNDRDKNDDK